MRKWLLGDVKLSFAKIERFSHPSWNLIFLVLTFSHANTKCKINHHYTP